ncbi:hypothetical protein [Nocardioides zeae]|uniref:Uncharacterized protein n=1 Tax=Nocardioides zeae TaxID=1457234 RepID=A0AAJ1TWY8_9ACTN|nr:hypothetical protein [Nocardioides zeae]MDQ1103801.1 hypothetical protein [Nocardioides zeae]
MSEHATENTEPRGVDVDPLGLAHQTDERDLALALPCPYDDETEQEDGSDTADAAPGTDEPGDVVEGGEA